MDDTPSCLSLAETLPLQHWSGRRLNGRGCVAGGSAHVTNKLQVGDILLAVNGTPVCNYEPQDLAALTHGLSSPEHPHHACCCAQASLSLQ